MIRRTVHAGLAALALALSATAMSLLLSACDHYPSDPGELEPPSLTRFGVTPDSVDLTHGAASATLSVGVRSPGGVDSALVVLASPSGEETLACVAREPANRSREAGDWECSVTLAPGQETGVWRTTRVSVHRGGAEVLRLLGSDLREANFPARLFVDQAMPPRVAITAPMHGERFTAGDSIHLEGSARDGRTETPLPDSVLVWTSSLDGEIGRGERFTTAVLSAGEHTLALTATGTAGLSGSDSVQVVVDERIEIASIEITPEAAGVTAIGDTVRFRARALDAAGNPILDTDFEWRTLDAKVATIEPSGVATARGRGTTLVWARAGGVTATASLTVHAPPAVGITAPEDSASFAAGDAVRLDGWGTRMADVPLPDSALVWTSDRDGEIGTGPVVTTTVLSVGDHTITLTGTSEHGLSSTATVRLTIEEAPAAPREVALITIEPEGVEVTMGDTVHLSATAHDATGAEIPGVVFTWSSDWPDGASVDSSGVVTGLLAGEGAYIITVAVGDIEASVPVLVHPPAGLPRAEIVSPADGAVFAAGDSIRLVGRGVGIDGEPITDDAAFRWRGTDQRVLGYGRELTIALSTLGEHTISLYVQDEYGFSAGTGIEITVEEALLDVSFILIDPYEAELAAIGDTVRFTARAFDRYEREITDAVFEWGSSDTTWVSIDADGLATANGFGSAWIYARVDSVSERARVRVVEPSGPPVAKVQVYPLSAPPGGVLPIGEAVPFVARAYDSEWTELFDLVFTWSSSDTTVATVDGEGAVTGRAPGRVTIRATTGGVSDGYEIEVGGTPWVSITAPEDGTSFEQGTPITFTGSAGSAAGEILTDSALVWTSDLDGELGTGERVDTEALSIGAHAITLTATDAHGQSASHSITIEITARREVTFITIEPDDVEMTMGDTVHLSATAHDATGAEIPGVVFTWSSDWPDGASVDSSGVVTALLAAEGAFIITAAVGDIEASARVLVYPPAGLPLAEIVSPADGAVFAAGDSIRLVGRGVDIDGEPIAADDFWWRGTDGRVLGYGSELTVALGTIGEHTISLYARGKYGFTAGTSIAIAVEPPTVHRVEVTPVEVGTTDWEPVQLAARAFDAAGRELTGIVFAWTTSDPEIAVVDSAGVAMRNPDSEGSGSAWIVTTAGTAADSTLFVVGRPNVTIDTPGWGSTFVAGEPVIFEGSGASQDGASLPDSALVWTSDRDGVLGTGSHLTTTALSPGEHHIALSGTDRFGFKSYPMGVRVTITEAPPTVASIGVWPLSAPPGGVLPIGEAVPFEARALDGDGMELTGIVFTWTSSDTAVAAVDGDGVVTGRAPGQVTIRASAGGVSGAHEIEVGPLRELSRIEVTPSEAGLGEVGDTMRLHARAFDQFDDDMPDVAFGWSVRGSSPVASISSTGLVTAQAMGLAFIDVTAGDHRAEVMLVVGPPYVEIVTPRPHDPDAEPPTWGSAITFVGAGVSRADEALAGDQLVWTSSIDGRIGTGERFTTTALSAGLHAITLTATDRFGLSASATVDTFVVMPAVAHRVEIDPPGKLFERIGETVQFQARAYPARGGDEEVPGLTYQWLSSDPSIVTIDANGLATARGWGEVEIIAFTNTGVGIARVFAGVPDFDGISISPPGPINLEVGGSYRLEAEGHRRSGEVGVRVPGIPVVWSSDDPSVATVDARGLVTAQGTGYAMIRATLGEHLAYIWVYVEGPARPIVYIDYPADGSVSGVGHEIYFAGWARDGRTELPLPASALVWTSSLDGRIGTGESFRTTALSAGEHVITLTATTEQGLSNSFSITVEVVLH